MPSPGARPSSPPARPGGEPVSKLLVPSIKSLPTLAIDFTPAIGGTTNRPVNALPLTFSPLLLASHDEQAVTGPSFASCVDPVQLEDLIVRYYFIGLKLGIPDYGSDQYFARIAQQQLIEYHKKRAVRSAPTRGYGVW